MLVLAGDRASLQGGGAGCVVRVASGKLCAPACNRRAAIVALQSLRNVVVRHFRAGTLGV